jgi:hypothetical protein
MTPVSLILCTMPLPCGHCWYCRQRPRQYVTVNYQRGEVSVYLDGGPFKLPNPFVAGWSAWGGPA